MESVRVWGTRARSGNARARVIERQDVREAVRIAAPLCLVVVTVSVLVLGIDSRTRLVLAVAALVALGSITWLSRSRFRRRPHVLALALVTVILVGRIVPLLFDIGTADLAEAYFGLVVVGSALFLPWSMRWHIAWVSVASGVYLTATLAVPRLNGTGAHEYV